MSGLFFVIVTLGVVIKLVLSSRIVNFWLLAPVLIEQGFELLVFFLKFFVSFKGLLQLRFQVRDSSLHPLNLSLEATLCLIEVIDELVFPEP